jgi:hypothetical protein
MPPSHVIVRDIADHLLDIRYIGKSVGNNWTSRFIARYELSTGRSRPKDFARLTSLTFAMIDALFDAFLAMVERYDITWCDIFNMDEKGFQMGQIGKQLMVFDKRNGPPSSASTGTTNWVSVIECVDAEGGSIPPFIIHMGKEVRDHWLLPNSDLPDWRWGFSGSGWTNNILGLSWLKDWYIPRTSGGKRH